MAISKVGRDKTVEKEMNIFNPSYRHSIVQSDYYPHTSLLSMVPGEPTLVEYYRGSLGASEEPLGFSPNSLATYQSYARIRNMILKFDGNVINNFVSDTGEIFQTGQCWILFDLTPIIGDLFIKDVGDGMAGLFQLTSQPEIKTINRDKVYYAEFKQIAIVDQAIANNLESKVVEEYIYSKESHVNGGDAVLTSEDINWNQELKIAGQSIIDHMLDRNYFNDEKTIIVPNKDGKIRYDPYLARFLLYTIPRKLIGPRDGINLLSVDVYNGNRAQQPITVWDMFYRNNFKNPKLYKSDYFLHQRESLLNTRDYGGIFHSKMDEVITVNEMGTPKGAYFYVGNPLPGGYDYSHPNTGAKGSSYNYYFSDGFYEGKGNEKEQFIWELFRDKTMSKKKMLDLVESYWDMDPIDQLYLGGIIILGIKALLVTNSHYR